MKLSLETLNQDPKYLSALRIIDELSSKGFMAYLVGGCVRDRYMGFKPNDYDIACNALPEQVAEVFDKKPFKVVPTGIEHGTLTIVLHAHAYEVTTLRQDVETDGRRAKVIFGSSLAEDAARRDFTMNAMFEDCDGGIKDFFQGREHISRKQLKFVGEASERIQEDYLRIMRFFRFKARFHLSTDDTTLDAIKTHYQGLMGISRERITKELWDLFSCKDIPDQFNAMVYAKVLPLIFSEVDSQGIFFKSKENLKKISCLNSTGISSSDLAHARIAFICLRSEQVHLGYRRWEREDLLRVLKGFRLSNSSLQKILGAVVAFRQIPALQDADHAKNLLFINELEAFGGKGVFDSFYFPFWRDFFDAFDLEPEYSRSLLHLRKIEDSFGKRRVDKLPINGKDVMRELTLNSGFEVGKAIDFLKRTYLNGEWKDRQQGLNLLKAQLKIKTKK